MTWWVGSDGAVAVGNWLVQTWDVWGWLTCVVGVGRV